jgi:hypothetical protein
MEDELFGEPRLSLLKASQHSTLYRTCATASLIFARLRAHNKMQNAWQIGAKRTRRRADRINRRMSAIGPKQTSTVSLRMSAFGMKADISMHPRLMSVFGPPMLRRPARRIFRATAQAENGRAVTNPACSELIYLWRNRHSVKQFAADGSTPIASHKSAGE